MSNVSGSVLGVDVGYSATRRSSAVCRLDWDATTAELTVDRFRAIEPERTAVLSAVADRPLAAAAFDGQLRSDLKVIGKYRRAEQLLTRRLQPFIGKPGQASSPVGKQLNAHANECAKIILGLGQVAPATHGHRIHRAAIVEARFYIHLIHLAQSGGLLQLLQHLLPGRRLSPPLAALESRCGADGSQYQWCNHCPVSQGRTRHGHRACSKGGI